MLTLFFSLIFMEDQECFLHLPSLSYVKLAFLGLQGKCAVSESLILLLLIFLSIIILLYGFFSKFNFYFFRSSSQIMGYTGINYSSPTLASAISNLTPAFTFVLAIIFRFLYSTILQLRKCPPYPSILFYFLSKVD